MAGDWLKIEASTPDKSEIWALSERLDIDPDAAFGKMFRIWSWFDQHTENGNAPSVTQRLLNRMVAVTGFCEAVVEAGWMLDDGEIISLPHFDRHNGKSAKKRAVTNRRVAKNRVKQRTSNAECNALSVTPSVSKVVTREEKRREDSKSKSSSKSNLTRVDSSDAEFQSILQSLAAAGFSHNAVHTPKTIPQILDWVAAGFTAADVTGTVKILKQRMNGDFPTSPAYLTKILPDYRAGTLEASKARSKRNLPAWTKIPRGDEALWPWAQKNDFPNAMPGQSNYEYRARLKSAVTQRMEAEGLT